MPQRVQTQAQPADFLFATEELHALADDDLIDEARALARAQRVTGVLCAHGELIARVEDPGSRQRLEPRLGMRLDWHATPSQTRYPHHILPVLHPIELPA